VNISKHNIVNGHGEVVITSYFLGIMNHKRGSPAFISYGTGRVFWYLYGKEYHDTIEYCKACKYNKERTLMWILKYGHTLPRNLRDI
jgi:hypothetical protein